MITISGQIAAAEGLRGEDRMLVNRLVKAWDKHRYKNELRHKYYLMKNTLKDLGISVPPELTKLNAACGWGKKVVDVMVEHLKFDGFTCSDAEVQAVLEIMVRRSKMRTLYRMGTTSALEQCFSLYFVYRDGQGRARVSAYPASVCGATWDDVHGCMEAALFVVSTKKDTTGTRTPDWVNVVTADTLIRIRIGDTGRWQAEYVPHGLGRLPVFVTAYEPTLDRPFGASRITRAVRGYIDSAVRANVNEEIASAFAVSTQKYLLGTDGDPFENVSRWNAYVGSIFNIDATEDGVIPQFGQLPQPSMEPLTAHWRNLCGRMSAETGIHVGQFGQVHDNPASRDAIYAENEPLILKCKDWNEATKDTLADIATALLATERGTSFDAIDSLNLGIMANLPNPAMPTLAQQTDASIKIASAVKGFDQTLSFWTMNGFSVEEAKRIISEVDEVNTKQATNAVITGIFGDVTTDASTS